jgi:hypothetical protein
MRTSVASGTHIGDGGAKARQLPTESTSAGFGVLGGTIKKRHCHCQPL